jgi:hypothetical protein
MIPLKHRIRKRARKVNLTDQFITSGGGVQGFGMNLAKVAPAASISWFVFEESKLYLHCPDVCHHK